MDEQTFNSFQQGQSYYLQNQQQMYPQFQQWHQQQYQGDKMAQMNQQAAYQSNINYMKQQKQPPVNYQQQQQQYNNIAQNYHQSNNLPNTQTKSQGFDNVNRQNDRQVQHGKGDQQRSLKLQKQQNQLQQQYHQQPQPQSQSQLHIQQISQQQQMPYYKETHASPQIYNQSNLILSSPLIECQQQPYSQINRSQKSINLNQNQLANQQQFGEVDDVDESRSLIMHLELSEFKVEACPYQCSHNHKQCKYYHSTKDRRRKNVEYTSEMCASPSTCPQGDGCQKAHNKVEELYCPEKYKTKFCTYYPHHCQKCDYGVFCSFAHSEEDITIDLIENYAFDEDFYIFYYKTVSCPFNFIKHDKANCVYSHNWQDYRRRPQSIPYEPYACHSWNPNTYITKYEEGCSNKLNCNKCHGWKESEYHPRNYKTKLCTLTANNEVCNKGPQCPYYHSAAEKRDITYNVTDGMFKYHPKNRNIRNTYKEQEGTIPNNGSAFKVPQTKASQIMSSPLIPAAIQTVQPLGQNNSYQIIQGQAQPLEQRNVLLKQQQNPIKIRSNQHIDTYLRQEYDDSSAFQTTFQDEDEVVSGQISEGDFDWDVESMSRGAPQLTSLHNIPSSNNCQEASMNVYKLFGSNTSNHSIQIPSATNYSAFKQIPHPSSQFQRTIHSPPLVQGNEDDPETEMEDLLSKLNQQTLEGEDQNLNEIFPPTNHISS